MLLSPTDDLTSHPYDIATVLLCHCPACRTSLIATRFWVVVICPIIKCVTVLEFFFYFVRFVLIHHNFILNYVHIVTFWIFTYHKIWILLIIFCFIWSYWIIYFLACLEVFWSVVSLLISAGPYQQQSCQSEHACYPIGCVIKSTHRGICSCSPIVNSLKFAFYHGMVTSVIFLIKK